MACYYYVRSRNRVPYTSHIGVDCPENRPKSWTDNGLGSVPSVNLVRALSKTAIFDDALFLMVESLAGQEEVWCKS